VKGSSFSLIQVNCVTFSYPSAAPVFQDFSWQAGAGEAWAVIGPSGCGKTSLLYLLAGLRFPSAGHVCVDGAPLTRPRPRTGLILQDYGLLPWASVRQNVELGLDIRRFYGPDGLHAPRQAPVNHDAQGWLERLGLAEHAHKFPAQLSGGQRQRVAIARTLLLRPDLLLMDEPFAALDAPTRLALEDLILRLWQEQGFTSVVVTHAIEEAAYLGQSILLLGRPPHTAGRVLPNPSFGLPGARDSEAYRQVCRELRAGLEEL